LILFEKTKPIYSCCVLRDAYCVKELEKTKPIYSYCVLRDAYCVLEFEKTKPMLIWAIWRNISNSNGLWGFCGFQRLWAAKNKANQSQFRK
jgi:hypothetical protein